MTVRTCKHCRTEYRPYDPGQYGGLVWCSVTCKRRANDARKAKARRQSHRETCPKPGELMWFNEGAATRFADKINASRDESMAATLAPRVAYPCPANPKVWHITGVRRRPGS